MRCQKLELYKYHDYIHRAVIKTQHGRIIYFEVMILNGAVTVTNYYYIDREKCGNYYAIPKKLKTVNFKLNEMLAVIAGELDRKYYGIDFNLSLEDKTTCEFIQFKLAQLRKKYKFLIFKGEGDTKSGIPLIISTRLKIKCIEKFFCALNIIVIISVLLKNVIIMTGNINSRKTLCLQCFPAYSWNIIKKR